jgi:GT2 family glycosyltransferase
MIWMPQTKIRLSIVVAASNNILLLEACLSSLKGQGEVEDTEIIVVSNYDDGIQELIVEGFPRVKLKILSTDATVPELRTQGILLSRGDIVALTEDNCILDENWCDAIKQAHELPHAVIGGSVDNLSAKRSLDWAVYFYEYGKYMPPNRAAEVDSLAGNNVSYKRAVLEKVEHNFREGFFETFIHWELAHQGHSLYMMPSAVVFHAQSYQFKQALLQCYHHGRSFAGKRTASLRPFKRMLFALGSSVLPILLPSRIALETIRKGRHVKELLFSLPHLVLLMASWSLGEFCGYTFGEGASSAKWT